MDSSAFIRWICRDRELRLADRALVMGILNVTPDSFSDGGRFHRFEQAVAHAVQMVNQGADIIDIGGESSRPGSEPVDADEEIARVVPVVEYLARRTPAVISVDTSKAVVAEAALNAGAHIVNDITGLTGDDAMIDVIRRHGAGAVIMHMQGTPRTMQDAPVYADVVGEVSDFLVRRTETAIALGLRHEQIVVDPGIGFGKTLDHNVALLRQLDRIARATGRPVLAGVSRKRFIGTITGRDTGDRLAGSLAAAAFAIMRGARIIRVHDVKESCDLALMMATFTSAEVDGCPS